MSEAQLLDYAQTTLILVLKLSMIPIVVATVIGLIVSLLQALTQIQEQTLGFAVKLIAISITIMLAAHWMGGELLLFTQDIFTNFPLDRKAMKAAMLTECVPASRYGEFISTLFKKQREWMLSRNTEEVLLRYAMLNGLTETQARDCINNDNLAKDIIEVRQQGLDRLKIKGTPAFLVVKGNEREILYGAPDYRTFKAYLQSKIAY